MQTRVLMLLPNLRVAAGTANFAMNYFRKLDPQRIHMDFAVWRDAPSPYKDEIKAKGCKVWLLPSVKKPLEHFRECQRILSEGHYDIVHDSTLLVSYPMMLAAVQRKVPVRILHSHNSRLGETPVKEQRNQLFLPLLRKTATDYAACSSLAAKDMFGDAKYSFIPNVINSDRFTFSPAERQRIRAELGLENRIVIGTVARPSVQKNPCFAVEVMEKLIDENPDVEYWWIGSGNMDEELKKRVEKSRFRDHIRLLGSREDVPDLFQAMDVFFLPSLFEGLPVTGVEAQAMGLPCVVSDTITKEFVYSDLVRFVGLNEPVENWVEALLSQITRMGDRRSYNGELQSSVFTDQIADRTLCGFYRECLKKSMVGMRLDE